MWKHFCIVPMSIHLLICIKPVGSRHWFGSIPVNLLLWDESIKEWLSDKLASSSGWTKEAISNANKISCGVCEGEGGCSWCVFVFKLEICFVQNSPYTFSVYLNTLVTSAPLPKEAPKPLSPPPLHTPPHHHYTYLLPCSKAAFPQAFPLKGQIFHLCNSVPY